MARIETIRGDVRPHIAAVARPGDTILIGFSQRICDEDYEFLKEQFREITDKGVKVGFIDGVNSMVVIKGPELDVNGAPLRSVEDYELEKEFPDEG